jgi:hypothetical protein
MIAMNGDSLVFHVVTIAALTLVFGVLVAAAVHFAAAAARWLHRRHEPRR